MMKRNAVVGHDNTQVGDYSPKKKSGRPAPARGTQGEMTQQSAEAAHERDSMPQKLLQLVGCRERKAGPDPWRRPRRITG
jgi:hypothetical protein